MNKTQYKWIVMAVCLCLGGRVAFGESVAETVKKAMDTTKQNADAMSTRNKNMEAQVNEADGVNAAKPDGISSKDALPIRKQNLQAAWNTQKVFDDRVAKLQTDRDAALQRAASNPSDKKAMAAAQYLENEYNLAVKASNANGTKIERLTNNLKRDDPGGTYRDPPNTTEKVYQVKPSAPSSGGETSNPPKIPVAMPSDVELQRLKEGKPYPSDLELPPKDGNKPPGKSDTGNDTSNPPKDNTKAPADADSLRNDLQTTQNTKDNIDLLIALAQILKLANSQHVTDNWDDSSAADANLQDTINDLQNWRAKINNRITDDLNQLHPNDPSKTPPSSNSGGGEGFINVLVGASMGMGSVVMAGDQGDEATQKFIDSLDGNSPGVDVRSSNSVADTARDNARDGIRDGIRDAANTARENAHSAATDNMRNCPDGH